MTCPACGSLELQPLGALGALDYHRCRACGLDSSTAREHRAEVQLTFPDERRRATFSTSP